MNLQNLKSFQTKHPFISWIIKMPIYIIGFAVSLVMISFISAFVILDTIIVYDFFFADLITNPTSSEVLKMNMLLFFGFFFVFNYPSESEIEDAKRTFKTDSIVLVLTKRFLKFLFNFSPLVISTILMVVLLEYDLFYINNTFAVFIPLLLFFASSIVFMYFTAGKTLDYEC